MGDPKHVIYVLTAGIREADAILTGGLWTSPNLTMAVRGACSLGSSWRYIPESRAKWRLVRAGHPVKPRATHTPAPFASPLGIADVKPIHDG
ncbi:hypothetical protein GCM10011317_14560 [Niveispirillum cyanobacteriorum]|nr:hypothetical protein GCM10011317_14560 [Niveispirillum cyanobacteriorum]